MKNKKPIIQQFLNREKREIMRQNSMNMSVYIYLFYLGITLSKRFGKSRREKKKLFNDISIFELSLYVFAYVSLYMEENYPEKKIIIDLIDISDIDELVRFYKKDVLNNLHETLSDLYINELEMDISTEMVDSRISFWRKQIQENNYELIGSILYSAIYNSPIRSTPTENVDENYNPLNVDMSSLVEFNISLVAFNIGMLEVFYEQVDSVFKDNPRFHYTIGTSEQSKRN